MSILSGCIPQLFTKISFTVWALSWARALRSFRFDFSLPSEFPINVIFESREVNILLAMMPNRLLYVSKVFDET